MLLRISSTHYIMKPMAKFHAPAAERNKAPILKVLQTYFTQPGLILEIGSGTGQHAVYFAQHLPHLTWQPSDIRVNLAGIQQWVSEADLPNLKPALELDVQQAWPIKEADGIFSANTAHIMSWAMVEDFIAGVGQVLNPNAYFCLYGPLNVNGEFTSPSNAAFDASLRAQNPAMGLRDFEALDRLAQQAGLKFIQRHALPANNFILVWQSATQKA